MIKMVVFDMAGTTVNEDNVVYKTVQAAINEAGFAVSLEAVLAAGAGKEKLAAIKSVLAGINIQDDALADQIFSQFNRKLTEAYFTCPISEQPNARKVLRALRAQQIKVVLNTGYNETTARSLLTKLGWQQAVDFDMLVTASDVKNNRPDPDMILLAMKTYDIEDGSQVMKVGDSTIDIEEGKNAGCTITAGITTGAHTREQLATAEPAFIIDNLEEVLTITEEMRLTMNTN